MYPHGKSKHVAPRPDHASSAERIRGALRPENAKKAPFALDGMPITYAISGSGAVAGYMPGEADWSSTAAGDLIAHLGRT